MKEKNRDETKDLLYPLRKITLTQNVASDSLSPLVLAYIGDAVFELYIRTYLVGKEKKPINSLHQSATALVRAGAQASLLKEIMPYLQETEINLMKRGRNTKSKVPRGASMADYRHATGLETLLGALFLEENRERLDVIMEKIIDAIEKGKVQ